MFLSFKGEVGGLDGLLVTLAAGITVAFAYVVDYVGNAFPTSFSVCPGCFYGLILLRVFLSSGVRGEIE